MGQTIPSFVGPIQADWTVAKFGMDLTKRIVIRLTPESVTGG